MLTYAERHERLMSLLRIVTFSLLMAGLVAVELYLHHAVIPDFLNDLKEADHKNSAWIGKELSYMLPFLTLAAFPYLVYRRAERGSMLAGTICPAVRRLQREKAWEILLTAVLIYGVILPYCIHLSNVGYEAALAEALASGTSVPQTEGKADDKLIYHLVEWFIRQFIPLSLLGLYHAARAAEPEEKTLPQGDRTAGEADA